MTWRTDKPWFGEFLVVDKIYRMRSVATFVTDRGWVINGRWLGFDAVECWQEIEEIPPKPLSTWTR